MRAPTVDIDAEELRIARWLVIVHQPEQWPAGTFCRNDHAVFPCSLHKWGCSALAAAGWTDDEIAALSQDGSQP